MSRKGDLESRYKEFSHEELINIVYVKNKEYDEEAIAVASNELKRRGVAQEEIEPRIKEGQLRLKEEQLREQKNLELPLSKKAKIFCFFFPGIGFYFSLFGGFSLSGKQQQTQRNKDAWKWTLLGVTMYTVLRLLIYLLISI